MGINPFALRKQSRAVIGTLKPRTMAVNPIDRSTVVLFHSLGLVDQEKGDKLWSVNGTCRRVSDVPEGCSGCPF